MRFLAQHHEQGVEELDAFEDKEPPDDFVNLQSQENNSRFNGGSKKMDDTENILNL